MTYKEIRANGKGSFTDFNLAIKNRTISLPKKKTIKEDIPFNNGAYDFSNINGEIYWEEREIEYTFDIAEFTVEEMEKIKDKVVDWVFNIHDTDIEDDYTQDYYYHGSYDDSSWKEDFGQGELKVTFVVYPFKYEKKLTTLDILATTTEQTITIENGSSHKVVPTIVTDGAVEITIGANIYSLSGGTYTSSSFILSKGINTWKIKGNANVNISFRKEVF